MAIEQEYTTGKPHKCPWCDRFHFVTRAGWRRLQKRVDQSINGKIPMSLICCVCGTGVVHGRQWWNRDRGYGVCTSCGEATEKREGKAAAEHYYGVKGVHWARETNAKKVSHQKDAKVDAGFSDLDYSI